MLNESTYVTYRYVINKLIQINPGYRSYLFIIFKVIYYNVGARMFYTSITVENFTRVNKIETVFC